MSPPPDASPSVRSSTSPEYTPPEDSFISAKDLEYCYKAFLGNLEYFHDKPSTVYGLLVTSINACVKDRNDTVQAEVTKLKSKISELEKDKKKQEEKYQKMKKDKEKQAEEHRKTNTQLEELRGKLKEDQAARESEMDLDADDDGGSLGVGCEEPCIHLRQYHQQQAGILQRYRASDKTLRAKLSERSRILRSVFSVVRMGMGHQAETTKRDRIGIALWLSNRRFRSGVNVLRLRVLELEWRNQQLVDALESSKIGAGGLQQSIGQLESNAEPESNAQPESDVEPESKQQALSPKGPETQVATLKSLVKNLKEEKSKAERELRKEVEIREDSENEAAKLHLLAEKLGEDNKKQAAAIKDKDLEIENLRSSKEKCKEEFNKSQLKVQILKDRELALRLLYSVLEEDDTRGDSRDILVV